MIRHICCLLPKKPFVVGGLVQQPVIAVPISVGYGAHFQGLAALLSMLNSCASGIGVINIDNGFGAVDSIVDIVGTCIALDQLDIDSIKVSTFPWSHGFVQCAHGTLPLPAPATLMLLRGFKFRESGIRGELITPTGASFVF